MSWVELSWVELMQLIDDCGNLHRCDCDSWGVNSDCVSRDKRFLQISVWLGWAALCQCCKIKDLWHEEGHKLLPLKVSAYKSAERFLHLHLLINSLASNWYCYYCVNMKVLLLTVFFATFYISVVSSEEGRCSRDNLSKCTKKLLRLVKEDVPIPSTVSEVQNHCEWVSICKHFNRITTDSVHFVVKSETRQNALVPGSVSVQMNLPSKWPVWSWVVWQSDSTRTVHQRECKRSLTIVIALLLLEFLWDSVTRKLWEIYTTSRHKRRKIGIHSPVATDRKHICASATHWNRTVVHHRWKCIWKNHLSSLTNWLTHSVRPVSLGEKKNALNSHLMSLKMHHQRVKLFSHFS